MLSDFIISEILKKERREREEADRQLQIEVPQEIIEVDKTEDGDTCERHWEVQL